MKEILNELKNENVVSLASIKDCKYDKRIIWNIFSMYFVLFVTNYITGLEDLETLIMLTSLNTAITMKIINANVFKLSKTDNSSDMSQQPRL